MTFETSFAALAWLMGTMTIVWGISLVRRDAGVVDPFWGVAFLVTSWIYVGAADAAGPRQVVVLAFVHVWGLRLSLYLLRRNWGKREDRRYRAMREHAGSSFPWRSLFVVFWLQAVLAWVISFPLHAALVSSRPALAGLDWLGVGLFVGGLAFEVIGDWQLARFKSDPANHGQVCRCGLWRYTRHPNYFGEAVLWWGLACFALATPGATWTLIGPTLLTVLLLKVSGVSLLEPDLRQRKADYGEYVARTSAFVPWLPKPVSPVHAAQRDEGRR